MTIEKSRRRLTQTIFGFVWTAALVMCGTTTLAQSQDAPKEKTEVQQLKDQLKQLEQTVEQLKVQLKTIEESKKTEAAPVPERAAAAEAERVAAPATITPVAEKSQDDDNKKGEST